MSVKSHVQIAVVAGHRDIEAERQLVYEIRYGTYRFSLRRLPNAQPSLSDIDQASATGQVVSDWDLDPLYVQPRDIVANRSH